LTNWKSRFLWQLDKLLDLLTESKVLKIKGTAYLKNPHLGVAASLPEDSSRILGKFGHLLYRNLEQKRKTVNKSLPNIPTLL
jgi:hypothetical protein